MAEDDNKQELEQAPQDQAAAKPHARLWHLCAGVGFIAAVLAWVAIVFNEYVCVALSWVALAAAIAGCWSERGLWRNMAVTALIAAAILLLVLALFLYGLDMLVASL